MYVRTCICRAVSEKLFNVKYTARLWILSDHHRHLQPLAVQLPFTLLQFLVYLSSYVTNPLTLQSLLLFPLLLLYFTHVFHFLSLLVVPSLQRSMPFWEHWPIHIYIYVCTYISNKNLKLWKQNISCHKYIYIYTTVDLSNGYFLNETTKINGFNINFSWFIYPIRSINIPYFLWYFLRYHLFTSIGTCTIWYKFVFLFVKLYLLLSYFAYLNI